MASFVACGQPPDRPDVRNFCCLSICLPIYLSLDIHTSLYRFACLHICIYECMNVQTYVRMYVCLYTYCVNRQPCIHTKFLYTCIEYPPRCIYAFLLHLRRRMKCIYSTSKHPTPQHSHNPHFLKSIKHHNLVAEFISPKKCALLVL